MSGSVESGRPTPTRTRAKSGGPEARSAATSGRCGRPGRRPRACGPRRTAGRSRRAATSTRSRSTLQRAARRADRAPGLVHVGLRAAAPRRAGRRGRCGPRSAARRTSSFGAAGAPSARASSSATSKPTLCGVPRVARARVAEPDDSQSTGRRGPPERRRTAPRYSESASPASARLAALVLAALGASPRPSPTSSVSCLELLLGLAARARRGERRDDGLVDVVEERDAARAP